MTQAEQQEVVDDFLEPYFGAEFSPVTIKPEEEALTTSVVKFVQDKFSDAKYVLGLALDFTLLAQKISQSDPEAKPFRPAFTKDILFARYTLVTSRGARQANTLSLQFNRRKEGIRKIEEAVVDLFVGLLRPGYPSAYVYNTGQWQKFQDTLLVPCFSLSESGRFSLCHKLIEFGKSNLKQSTPIGRAKPRARLFEDIIRSYPRGHETENAGAVFQGMVAGFIKADRPHLFLIVDKTRTGSARQARIGDLDGYHGLDLEMSVEVKDHPLTADNVTREIGEFLAKVKQNRVMGLVFCQAADASAARTIRDAGAASITLEQFLGVVETWDWRKQDAAVNGLLHYLAHVEQNPEAVERLLAFIQTKDASHDSLIFYKAAVSSS